MAFAESLCRREAIRARSGWQSGPRAGTVFHHNAAAVAGRELCRNTATDRVSSSTWGKAGDDLHCFKHSLRPHRHANCRHKQGGQGLNQVATFVAHGLSPMYKGRVTRTGQSIGRRFAALRALTVTNTNFRVSSQAFRYPVGDYCHEGGRDLSSSRLRHRPRQSPQQAPTRPVADRPERFGRRPETSAFPQVAWTRSLPCCCRGGAMSRQPMGLSGGCCPSW
jgi:hypothetical protein